MTELDFYEGSNVAPFTGAWIEIVLNDKLDDFKDVAPFTGAWIEISNTRYG